MISLVPSPSTPSVFGLSQYANTEGKDWEISLRTVVSGSIIIIMAYGSTPYVGMTPKKNGDHIESAQMTRSKCLHRSVNGFHEPYQALSSTSMVNRTVNLLESIAKVPRPAIAKTGQIVYLLTSSSSSSSSFPPP